MEFELTDRNIIFIYLLYAGPYLKILRPWAYNLSPPPKKINNNNITLII
jgi:hypothetical protein